MRKIVALIVGLTIHVSSFSQKNLIASGPMLGRVDLKEVALWVQTLEAANVHFEYWPTNNPKEVHKTEQIQTKKKDAFTATCVVDEVEPGITYEYRVFVNGKKTEQNYPTKFTTQSLWQWRTDPPAFSVAAGSCNYVNEPVYDRPGKPYGSEHEIFQAMAKVAPYAMIWLGDNTYLREVDWSTRSGILHRYTHTRALPEIQPFLASTAQYATWDDHDYGPNDADGTWVHKGTSLEAFKMFWPNPTYGLEEAPGVSTAFKLFDMDFFLLDNRYHRTPNDCETCPDSTVLGKQQLDWLLKSLSGSRAPFKMVAMGGQFLTTSKESETYINLAPSEREQILKHIESEGIKNVIFLTGDRHFTELSTLVNSKGIAVYDLTTSSLTAGSFKGAEEKIKNENRVAGTVFDGHNFALLNFSGKRTERELEIKIVDKDGKEVWSRKIVSQK